MSTQLCPACHRIAEAIPAAAGGSECKSCGEITDDAVGRSRLRLLLAYGAASLAVFFSATVRESSAASFTGFPEAMILAGGVLLALLLHLRAAWRVDSSRLASFAVEGIKFRRPASVRSTLRSMALFSPFLVLGLMAHILALL